MDEQTRNHASLNQTMYRADESVWDRRGWNGQPEHASLTRILVGVGGGALAVQGLRQGTWQGRMLAGIGTTLAMWALTGKGDLTEARQWFTDVLERRPWLREDDHVVMDASADSFPASDSPAWTPTVGTGLRRRVTH